MAELFFYFVCFFGLQGTWKLLQKKNFKFFNQCEKCETKLLKNTKKKTNFFAKFSKKKFRESFLFFFEIFLKTTRDSLRLRKYIFFARKKADNDLKNILIFCVRNFLVFNFFKFYYILLWFLVRKMTFFLFSYST